jgi:REP-associated tyrosine transposase
MIEPLDVACTKPIGTTRWHTRPRISSRRAALTLSPSGRTGKLIIFVAQSGWRCCIRGLFTVAERFGWQLEAWAVFSNHYHFVAHSPASEAGAVSLSRMVCLLHERTAKWVNRLDGAAGRQVWHNFRETRLSYEKSYLARLSYTHQNAVKHGLVRLANLYPWCSAAWFERTATHAQVKTIYSFKIDRLQVSDDYEVAREW